jgi:uncharacterized protein YjbJ (UPF0337 family)
VSGDAWKDVQKEAQSALEVLDKALRDASYECLIDKSLKEQPLGSGVILMSGKTDLIKGRIKEAAGALTGNDKLREEGKADQTVGKAKQAVQNAADTVKNAVNKVIK